MVNTININSTSGIYGFIVKVWGQPRSFFADNNIESAMAFETALLNQAEYENINIGEYYVGRGAGNARTQSETRFRQVRKPIKFWVALSARAGYPIKTLTN